MITSEHVHEDPHAWEEHRCRGYVIDDMLGLTDSAAATPEEALARARIRYRLRWLGVEEVGLVRTPAASSPAGGAVISGQFRYALWRQVSLEERVVCWVMLNPSTANHEHDDATIRRVRAYTREFGYGWFTVANCWPYRATDPAELRRWLVEQNPRELANARAKNAVWLRTMARRAQLVIAAWGSYGADESQWVLELLAEEGKVPHALAITADGQPRHPLRLPARLAPTPLRQLQELIAA